MAFLFTALLPPPFIKNFLYSRFVLFTFLFSTSVNFSCKIRAIQNCNLQRKLLWRIWPLNVIGTASSSQRLAPRPEELWVESEPQPIFVDRANVMVKKRPGGSVAKPRLKPGFQDSLKFTWIFWSQHRSSLTMAILLINQSITLAISGLCSFYLTIISRENLFLFKIFKHVELRVYTYFFPFFWKASKLNEEIRNALKKRWKDF